MDHTIEWYMQHLESVRGSGEPEVEALLTIARALIEDESFDEGRGYLEEALALSITQQDQLHQRDIHGMLALGAVTVQDFDGTYEHAQQAISLSRDDPEELLKHYSTLMYVLIMTPLDTPPHAYAEALIEELRNSGVEQHILYQMMHMLAETYGMTDNLERGIAILEAEVDRAGEKKWLALMQLGSLEIGFDRFNDGYRHLKEARSIVSQQNNLEGEGVVLMALGAVCVDTGRPKNGIRYLKSALDIARRLGEPHLQAMILSELGNAYNYSQEFEKALATYQEMIDFTHSNQDVEGEMTSWASTGNVYRNMDNPPEAIKAYKKALTLSSSLDNPYEEAQILTQIGQAFADNGEFPKGVKHIEQALQLFTQLNEEPDVGNCYLTLAMIYMQYDHIPEARDAAEKSRQIFEQFHAHDMASVVDAFLEEIQ